MNVSHFKKAVHIAQVFIKLNWKCQKPFIFNLTASVLPSFRLQYMFGM